MFIYKTTNTINGKQYIGLCTREDDKYLGSGKLLKQAIKKYGKDNFNREIIEECDDFEYLCEREIYWIEYYNAVENDNFYNLSYGGNGGDSKLMKEYWSSMTPEQRKNSRNWKPHFKGLDQSGDNHISKNDPNWTNSVSEGVKASWDKYTEEERASRGNIISQRRKELGSAKGKKNPMYGRSVVKEKNLKWYTNGVDNLYIPEGTQPKSYHRGRTMKKKSSQEK
jgi:hypothetical protein